MRFQTFIETWLLILFVSGICLSDEISIPGDCRYPATASEGNSVYMACLGADEKPANLYFRRSIDKGRTWSGSRRINKKNGDCLPPSIAVNSGIAHLTWIDYGGTADGEIYYTRSLDGGETWEKNVVLVKNASRARYVVITCKENNVYLSWQNVENKAFFTASNDQGRTWENETLLEKVGQESKKSGIEKSGIEKSAGENKRLTNIVLTEKKMSAYGWGEYEVGGRCLCCDNFLDGDCIVVHTTNRTERIRIKQIVDGKLEADTNDRSTYFGDVDKREGPAPVSFLMAEITIKKMRDIYKVIVYTMADKEKNKNFLRECELGYYDRFERLQWVEKKESKGSDDHIAFEMEKPIFTNSILLKVRGGKSKMTEVALFSKKE